MNPAPERVDERLTRGDHREQSTRAEQGSHQHAGSSHDASRQPVVEAPGC
jgi:hypothetical protein